MSGQWSGGAANRTWQRPGHRVTDAAGDRDRGRRLFALVAQERFWCDNCGACHPLIEHRGCRAAHPFQTAFRGSV